MDLCVSSSYKWLLTTVYHPGFVVCFFSGFSRAIPKLPLQRDEVKLKVCDCEWYRSRAAAIFRRARVSDREW